MSELEDAAKALDESLICPRFQWSTLEGLPSMVIDWEPTRSEIRAAAYALARAAVSHPVVFDTREDTNIATEIQAELDRLEKGSK